MKRFILIQFTRIMLKTITSYLYGNASPTPNICLPNDVMTEIAKYVPDKITLAHLARANRSCAMICRAAINYDLKVLCPTPVLDSALISNLWNIVCGESKKRKVELTFMRKTNENIKFKTLVRKFTTLCPGYEYDITWNDGVKIGTFTKIGTGELLFTLFQMKKEAYDQSSPNQMIGFWAKQAVTFIINNGRIYKAIIISIPVGSSEGNLTMIEKVHDKLISIMSKSGFMLERTAANLQTVNLVLTGWSSRKAAWNKTLRYILPNSLMVTPPISIYGPRLTLQRCLKYWNTF